MPEAYPAFWNALEDLRRNTDYALYILEIAKASDDRWLLSLSLTEACNCRYYLGGRFRLYVKKGDVIPLRFYSGDDGVVTATVSDIDYNVVSLQFSVDD